MDHLALLPLWSRCDLPLPKIAATKGPRLPISAAAFVPVLHQSRSSDLASGCGSLCLCSSVPQLLAAYKFGSGELQGRSVRTISVSRREGRAVGALSRN
ncbi:unnamed protein product [Cyprideis torosa]|uniref:Uncharacterized protein n=1 Tax=Cyprideis torosa TaxID=163714 RepID=A0A7R8ZNK0_9CRUS|nr:unnamed protein product [Cyprideis torosa]CAG0898189.1 unnamed protein product [Cyprideis torosa]